MYALYSSQPLFRGRQMLILTIGGRPPDLAPGESAACLECWAASRLDRRTPRVMPNEAISKAARKGRPQ